MRHEHADLIHAWAEGAQIQVKPKNYYEGWEDIKHPRWFDDHEYRIKPEPKPDVVRFFCLAPYQGDEVQHPYDSLRLTFDGETGKLKSAEVL